MDFSLQDFERNKKMCNGSALLYILAFYEWVWLSGYEIEVSHL